MRRLAILFGACLLLVAIVYRHAPSAFLRAESGLWLRMAHADATAQQEFTRRLLTESYNGHYTPLFFLGEFETAKIAGTNRAFWRWRQILAVALLAAVSVVTLTTAT